MPQQYCSKLFLFCDYNIKSTHPILKIRICISTKQSLNNTMVTFPAGNHHGWLTKLQVTFNILGRWLLPMFQFCYCAQISTYFTYFHLSLHPKIKLNTSTWTVVLLLPGKIAVSFLDFHEHKLIFWQVKKVILQTSAIVLMRWISK